MAIPSTPMPRSEEFWELPPIAEAQEIDISEALEINPVEATKKLDERIKQSCRCSIL